MQPAPPLPIDPTTIDQRVVFHDMSWQAYEAMLAWRGDRRWPRMTYLEGELELMSPSSDHEVDKTLLARLLEAFAEEMAVPLDGAGSWTVKREDVERAAEADECYVLGNARGAAAPDIAIEVVRTSGGIDKLEVWRKLGVGEVWIWENGALSFYVLHGARYAKAVRSRLVPRLDPALIARCMRIAPQVAAVKELRKALRAGARRR